MKRKRAKRVWDKGDRLDAVIERFTVGRDPELDLRLLAFDALGSAAHAKMLASVGLLDSMEIDPILSELRVIVDEARAGRFVIQREEEDCHTAIENRLTQRLGDPGRRIHAGRSRNDQIIAALRLYAREALIELSLKLFVVTTALCDLAERHKDVCLPGYSHTRQAMPSTLGLFFGAFAEGLVDDFPWIETAFNHVNRSPLGSASGFGVPLPLDREQVASLLRFDSVQANTLAVQNDRGKTEHLVLTACSLPALDLARLATDLIWYSSDELGYITLSGDVTTGSSIMPQKRNPDALELVRATGAKLRNRTAEVIAISGPLSSGYHRDLQLTKEPFLEGLQASIDVLVVMHRVLDSLDVDMEKCREALNPSIGATDAMCQRVASGTPLRSAYQEVAKDPAGALFGDSAEAWRLRTHIGAPGNLDIKPLRESCAAFLKWIDSKRALIEEAWKELMG